MRAVDRRVGPLLLASLGLHCIFLLLPGLNRVMPPSEVTVPLLATLRLVAQTATAQAEFNPPPVPPVRVPKARPKAEAAVLSTPSSLTTAGPASSSSAPEAQPLRGQDGVFNNVPQSRFEGLSGSSAPSPAARDTLEIYRQRLTALFATRHDYPRIAALRGWEGEVRLRLTVARQGNLLGVALDRSSGHDVLDRHALSWLTGYGDLPPLPESLSANEISLVVPIQYKLRKTT